MLLSSPLCLLLCWMLPVDSMIIRSDIRDAASIPLDMAESSVDDMYFGCEQSMARRVNDTYFNNENSSTFWDVWENAYNCTNRSLNERRPGDEALTKDHFQAICVYTSEYKKFYITFNNHVRSDRSVYGTEFPFHSLHFWLTTAVQILNKNECVTTYRRTNQLFTGEVNQTIRFGSFSSSSNLSNQVDFGNTTCFKIATCFGGFLKSYSDYPYEEEVLIPPYEMFTIIAKQKGADVDELSDCDVVFVLKSSGIHSNLNCRAVKSPE